MAELRTILKYLVVDSESGQTFAGFASKTTANEWAEAWSERTDRKYEVRNA